VLVNCDADDDYDGERRRDVTLHQRAPQ